MKEAHASDQPTPCNSDVPPSSIGRESDITEVPRDADSQEVAMRSTQVKEEEKTAESLDPSANSAPSCIQSKGYKCLQSGAIFKGVQRSGQNSYDAEMNIIDIDIEASFLCGHLSIRGLTKSHLDVTTYFDAQIIGTSFGFDTKDGVTSRQDDTVHWSRFRGFHEVKKDLIEPDLLLPDNTNRSFLFMRWKERYVVPEDGPQDLDGASFAGKSFRFYYIYVEFAPPPAFSDSSAREETRLWNDEELSGNVPEAKIFGYYYEPNSEPYVPAKHFLLMPREKNLLLIATPV
ncbi:hypothetical protein ACEPAG_8912 [Sanghuangporus baumii]